MRLVVAVVLLSAGCRQLFGIQSTTLGDGGDDGGDATDGPVDAPPGCDVIPDLGLAICLAQPPTMAVTLSTVYINTQAQANCAYLNAGSDVCVVAGTTLDIPSGALVTAHGQRQLIFYATSEITIEGTVDVASHIGSVVAGPSANAASCLVGAAPTGSGGGAGGSFQTSGGNGGAGAGGAGGSGGIAGNGIPATTLHGGCPGGAGGGGATGGAGGGAALFFAPSIVLSSGTINASGASGFGAALNGHGGGAGGSGGMIAFYASSISVDGLSKVYANGGHGGGGSGTIAGTNGDDPSGPTSGGGSGQGGGNGGAGGSGYPVVQNGFNGGGVDGGGGGGGGAGVIRVVSSMKMSNGQLSPPPT